MFNDKINVIYWWGWVKMKNWLNTFYFFVLGVISLITHEVVTFIMLGIILIALNNIHSTLKEILETNRNKLD
jgi:hypothetical protein